MNRKLSFLTMPAWVGLIVQSCGSGNATTAQERVVHDTLSIFDDPGFRNGLALSGTNTSDQQSGKYLFPFGEHPQSVRWRIAEWGSRYPLSSEKTVLPGGEIVYENRGKTLGLSKKDDVVSVRMEVMAEHEYDKPREEGTYWPHLLLEQAFQTPTRLSEIEALLVQLDAKLLFSELNMPESAFNKDLHSAQFQVFITLQDGNPESPGQGDFLWFGFPLYDYRYRDVPAYMAEDIGKDDASGKYIYMLSSTEVIDRSMHDKQWVSVRRNILDDLTASFKKAQEKGYLKNSSLADMYVTSLNIGWENTATINSGVLFRNLDIQKVVKRE